MEVVPLCRRLPQPRPQSWSPFGISLAGWLAGWLAGGEKASEERFYLNQFVSSARAPLSAEVRTVPETRLDVTNSLVQQLDENEDDADYHETLANWSDRRTSSPYGETDARCFRRKSSWNRVELSLDTIPLLTGSLRGSQTRPEQSTDS